MFVRAVKAGTWRKLRVGSVDEAVAELVKRGTWVSVFECRSQEDLELIAVAFSAERTSRDNFDYVEILDEDLSGIEVVPSEGTTRVGRANALHRDIDLRGDRARLLVERIAARSATVPRISVKQLKAAARRLAQLGQGIPQDGWLFEEP